MSVPAIGLVSTGYRARPQQEVSSGQVVSADRRVAREGRWRRQQPVRILRGMHSIAGRPAGSTGGQQPQLHSIRDQQPRAAQQHSWLQRLRPGGGSQKPLFLFAEREFILLGFFCLYCGVSLVSLSSLFVSLWVGGFGLVPPTPAHALVANV